MTYRHPFRAGFYHPYNFLFTEARAQELFLKTYDFTSGDDRVVHQFNGNGNSISYEFLIWDSGYFEKSIYRINYIDLAKNTSQEDINSLLANLTSSLASRDETAYIYIEVPSEDLEILEGISVNSWKLVETRLSFFHPNIAQICNQNHDEVRLATSKDVHELRNTAMNTRNEYDRFHSDSYFSPIEVDNFMGVFVENSLNGREDYVVVPKHGPADAFFAGSRKMVGDKISVGRMTLSAVSTARKGWHLKVARGLCEYFYRDGLSTAVMTTQSTNRAVLTNLRKLDFQFGRSSHIFSFVISLKP